ncbi:hypothetical protein Tco_0236311 [Tanacetum coccineum]
MIHFRILHTLFEDFSKEDLTNNCFWNGFQRAFSAFFGEDVEYFAPMFFFNMDKLEKQLNEAEFNKEISMVVFKVFKNQFQHFITQLFSMDYGDQMANQFFTKYTLCDAKMFQNILISQIDSVKKAIVEKGLYKRAHDSMDDNSRLGNDTHVGDEKIDKDASEIDNNVAKASHDKDNMSQTLCMLTNEQSLYQENKQKMGLGYTDLCFLGQAIACNPKLYDAEVFKLQYVKPDVHDTEKILNDVEESQVKMKEKQFQVNYEGISSLYDTFVPQTELSLEQ